MEEKEAKKMTDSELRDMWNRDFFEGMTYGNRNCVYCGKPGYDRFNINGYYHAQCEPRN